MNNVVNVNFSLNKKTQKPPRQRVFYLGQYYAGPPLCQSLEKLWIKRKPNNMWVFQSYQRGRVFEQEEEYSANDLLDALNGIPFVDEILTEDLKDMGWYNTGEIINLEEFVTGIEPTSRDLNV